MELKIAIKIARQLLKDEKGKKVLLGIIIAIIFFIFLIASIFQPIFSLIDNGASAFEQVEDIKLDDEDFNKLLNDEFVITESKYYKLIDKAKSKYLDDINRRLEERANTIKEEHKKTTTTEVKDEKGNISTSTQTTYPEVNIGAINPPINLVLAYFMNIETRTDNNKKVSINEIIDFFKRTEKEIVEETINEDKFYLSISYKDVESLCDELITDKILEDDADKDLFMASIDRISELMLEAGVGGYTGTPSGSISNTEMAKKIWDYLKAKGWSDYAVAGILGNIEAECSFKPSLQEKGGTGIGLFQWSFSRRDKFLSFMKSKGYELSNIEGQLEYLLLENTWYGGRKKLYNSGGITHLAKANSLAEYGTYNYEKVSDSVEDFCWHWEGPNYQKAQMDRRQGAALEALNLFANGNNGVIVDKGSYAKIKASYFLYGKLPESDGEMRKYLVSISFKNSKGILKKVTIHKLVANELLKALEDISEAGYEIKQIGGYSFRKKVGSKSGALSSHSYGLAIDINENYGNPFIKGGKVIVGTAYGSNELSMYPNSIPVKRLKEAGWKWGGEWTSSKDYMHFSIPGD